jgi:hypothetical protein
MKASTKAIRFLEMLAIPAGPKVGQLIKLAPLQKKFSEVALSDGVNVVVQSIGQAKAKTAMSAGIAFGAAIGARAFALQAAYCPRSSLRILIDPLFGSRQVWEWFPVNLYTVLSFHNQVTLVCLDRRPNTVFFHCVKRVWSCAGLGRRRLLRCQLGSFAHNLKHLTGVFSRRDLSKSHLRAYYEDKARHRHRTKDKKGCQQVGFTQRTCPNQGGQRDYNPANNDQNSQRPFGYIKILHGLYLPSFAQIFRQTVFVWKLA